MFITRAVPDQVNTNRLDADFYRPEYLVIDQKLASLETALLGTCGKFFAGPFGSKLPSNLYLNEGIPLFRVGNVGQFEVLTDNFAHLASTVHQELLSSEVVPGDILIVKASVGEKIAKIPDWLPKANITQHIIGIRPNGTFDSDFICAFLYSKYGRSQLERFALGSIIQYLGIHDARSVTAYKPSAYVQKYIGDKVRQAERLRAWAKYLKGEVDKQIESLELPYDSAPEMINKVACDTLSDRLDPRPYRTHSLGLVEAIKKIHNSQLSDCVFMSSGCPVSSKDFSEDFDVPLVRIRNIGSDEFSGLDIGVSTAVYQAAIKYSAKPGYVVIGMDGDFRAQFFLEAELPMLINQRVAVFKPKDIRPELLTHWLNRPEGQIQLYQWAVKTTVDHTSLTDLKKVRIPRFESEREEELADMLLSARLARYYARKLTTSAKFLVEALIEGAVTEQQLIDAQKALEAGDTSLDREILARLTTKGLDGDDDPLFPDLDQLYDLLAQSQSLDE